MQQFYNNMHDHQLAHSHHHHHHHQRQQPVPVMYQKRHRTTFNQYQLSLLEEAFKQNSYPSPSFRAALATETNLDPSRIQVWFQNRRAKHKKQVNQARRCFNDFAMSLSGGQASSLVQQQQQQQQQSQHQVQHQQQQQQQQHQQHQQHQNRTEYLIRAVDSVTSGLTSVSPIDVKPLALLDQQPFLQQQQQQHQQQQQQHHNHHQQQQQQPHNLGNNHQQYQINSQQRQQQHERMAGAQTSLNIQLDSNNSESNYYDYYKQIESSLRSTVEYLH